MNGDKIFEKEESLILWAASLPHWGEGKVVSPLPWFPIAGSTSRQNLKLHDQEVEKKCSFEVERSVKREVERSVKNDAKRSI